MESQRTVTVVGLVGLLVLDFALITWALWPSSTATATQAPSGTPSPQMTTAGAAASPPAPEEGAPAGDPVPLARLVVAASATTAWLVDAGSCDSPGSVHVTVTGGDEWATQSTPGSVTRVRPNDASTAFVVGGDADCQARVWYTGDGGDVWGAPQSAAQAWGRDPQDPQLVLRPGGEPVQPCPAGDVLDLVGLSGGAAAALCDDGSVRATADLGGSWTTADSREGLLAISLVTPGEGVAAGLEDGCSGLAVSPISGSSLGESVCVEDVTPAPGQVAISATDGAVWLVAGDDVLRAERFDGPFGAISAWPGS